MKFAIFNGKRIKADHIILKALSLLKQEHINDLQEESLSNKDKLERSYKNYCKKFGTISKDEFIGKFMKVENYALSENPSQP